MTRFLRLAKDKTMTPDDVISYLHSAAKVLRLASHLPVQGASYLSVAADGLDALAADRAKVEEAFRAVSSLSALAQAIVAWLENNGHPAAARYLSTSL